MLDAACDSGENACLSQDDRKLYCGRKPCRSVTSFRRKFSRRNSRRYLPGNGFAWDTKASSARPGDFFVQEVAGESLDLVRDQKGAVRGFYNVCRHRGTRLCEETSGHCAAIQCPYHAWTYALDGRLIGAPHMDEVPGFDKADYSLHAVKLGQWEGFIFVNLADEAVAAGAGLCASGREVWPLESAAPPLGPTD